MNNTHKLLKNYFDSEVNHAEVKKAQQDVLRQSEKLFPAASVRWIPTLSTSVILAACFLGVVWIYPNVFTPKPQAISQVPVIAEPQMIPAQEAEEALTPDEHAVIVKRLTSSVGPTMIYQKMYQDHPLTVVWVFSKEAQS